MSALGGDLSFRARRYATAAAWLAVGHVASPALPSSALQTMVSGRWAAWWRSESAPVEWTAPPPAFARAVTWRSAQPGVEWGEITLSVLGQPWQLRAVIVRVDPRRVRFRLTAPRDLSEGGRVAWAINAAPPNALLAFNAGQFSSSGQPWGWVVRGGREQGPPGTGPLSAAVVVDSSRAVRLVPADGIAAVRARGEAVEAFQSYPVLLEGDGRVPDALRARGRGVDLTHRDSRLALGVLRDGRVLIVLTRVAGLGRALEALPLGLRTPEMAALMGALGCRQAVMLDGGLSGQLLVREEGGERRMWSGLRDVALGVVATPYEAIRAEDTPRTGPR